ncbi:MAG: Rho termination factor N-terminal domain-containing protein, partial [Cardiobacteriaceae bacterium]|nr:Rho termination factor N-terminal domain-containing protein [Cardiobacteriaceae bacterium]
MHLSDLKQKSPQEILAIAEEMGLEDISRKRKQDLIFAILKAHAKNGEEITGEGTVELLADGYGFLRAEVNSYQANPDDIYVSPS